MQDGKTVILHMIETTGSGGAEQVIVDIVRHLDREKFISVVVLTGKGWLYDNISSSGVVPEIIKSEGAYDWRFIRKVMKLSKLKKVDVIHSHLDDTNFYACLVGIFSRIPVIATYHGMIGSWNVKNVKDSIKMAIIKFHAKYVVAVSEFLKTELLKAGSFKNSQLRRIYNGVDFQILGQEDGSKKLRSELNLPQEAILIGTIGNMERWKGFDYFIKAVPTIIEKSPKSYFLIIGEIKEDILGDLDALIASLKLEGRIFFMGFRGDIPQILTQLDIFVLPSLSEGLSIATIEAMAKERPVIVTDSGGPTEIVDEGRTGFVVPPKDPEAIAQRVIQLINDPNLAQTLGKQAKIAVQNKFDLKSTISTYADLYLTCLE